MENERQRWDNDFFFSVLCSQVDVAKERKKQKKKAERILSLTCLLFALNRVAEFQTLRRQGILDRDST